MKLKGFVTPMRAALDNKLRRRDDLVRLNTGTLLGSIPKEPQGQSCSLVSEVRLNHPRADAFRQLWTDLRFAQIDDPNQVVLVTPAQSKEGKTSTSINLAITAARTGSRVALIDVDLREPTVASKLGLENAAGLTTVLLGGADVSELFQPWGTDELSVLTAGETPSNPLELLNSRAMRTLMARLTEEFDLVILDGTPVLSAADSLVVAQHVGQILLVAAVGEVQLNHVEEALMILRTVEVPTGIVLTKVPPLIAENASPRTRPQAWDTEFVHPAFPEDLSTTISHVRSQS